MKGLFNGLTSILGFIAVLACLATVAIIGYSFFGGGAGSTNQQTAGVFNPNGSNIDPKTGLPVDEVVILASPVPSTDPVNGTNPDGTDVNGNGDTVVVPTSIDPSHVHDYQPVVIKKATCYEAGQIKYTCSCGDYYLVDQLSTGHVPDDWEIVKDATEITDGQRVRKCIYCDEVIASETIPATGSVDSVTNADGTVSHVPPHRHLYISTIEREPTCTLSGLRKLTCECGDFYTESIPAVGHVAEEWNEVVAPTSTSYGTSQRTCAVCGALLDTKVLIPLSPSPSTSASASASGSAAPSASASPSGTPQPTPTPHVHNYHNYIVTPATCTTKGVRSYICACGSSYAESIELDLNNHLFKATVVDPTDTQQGYTVYTCTRCNYSYKDNYLMPLTNTGSTVVEDEEE